MRINISSNTPQNEEQLRPTQAELNEILVRHQVWLDTDGCEGTRAFGEPINLEGIDLSGTNLKQADFSHAFLHNANLANACLSDAEGLSQKKLAGADLGNTELPRAIAEFNGLRYVEEISKNARNIFFVLMLACAYCWLTIGTTVDARLVANSGYSKLPIIDTQISISWFYWVAPITLLLAYIYFNLYLQKLWTALASLPAVFPNGSYLNERVYPWLLTSIASGAIPRLRGQTRHFSGLETAVSVLLTWWIIPMTLAAFWLRYLSRLDLAGTLLHLFVVLIGITAAVVFRQVALATLRGETTFQPTHHFFYKATPVIVAVLLITFGLSGYVIWSSRTILLGYSFFPDLRGERLSGEYLRQADLHHALASDVILDDSDLRGTNLEGVDMTRANLRNADLRDGKLNDTILTGADLRKAKLQGSFLSRADLRNARLREAKLEAAHLERADLRQADLRKTDFQGAFLMAADLRGARLNDIDLRNANLVNAKLQKVRMRKADLRNAMLDSANLIGANLRRANLQGTHNTLTKFSKADLRKTDFSNADIQEVDFNEAKLKDADFVEARLTGVSFHGVKMKGAKFSHAILNKVNFNSANMNRSISQTKSGKKDKRKSDFSDADLQEVDFKEAKLKRADFKEARLTSVNFYGANMNRAKFVDTRLTGVSFNGTKMKRAKFVGATLTDVTFNDAKLDRAKFHRTKFIVNKSEKARVEFHRARLRRAEFEDTDLSGSNFQSSDLNAATFFNAILTNADFTGTKLMGVNFLQVTGLDTVKFDDACDDNSTKWPDNFSPPSSLSTCETID